MRSRIIPSIATLVAFALLLTACTFATRNDDTIPLDPIDASSPGRPGDASPPTHWSPSTPATPSSTM